MERQKYGISYRKRRVKYKKLLVKYVVVFIMFYINTTYGAFTSSFTKKIIELSMAGLQYFAYPILI
ncbi:hypothetical protein BW1_005_03790 [Bacillus mycoides NBRC 101238 = DSM 11821]|nr:hypothetical protein BW1_005_03790 [Bacillus mycoides NBRC 101238 = DSM 11821]